MQKYKLVSFTFSICLSSVALSQPPTLLKEEDLEKAKVFSHPERSEDFGPGQFWVCINPRESRVRLVCDDLGKNENGFEESKAELNISFHERQYDHFYGLRHGIYTSECLRILYAIRTMTMQERSICVRGGMASVDGLNGKNPKIGWVFDEAKTAKQTNCEFNGCD